MSQFNSKAPKIQPWTIPAIVLVALVLLLANIAPVWSVRWSCDGGFVGNNEFGWPCTYLWTPLTTAQKIAVTHQGPRGTWLLPAGDLPCFGGIVEGFKPVSLAVNVICSFLMLLLSAVFVEHVQRIGSGRPALTVRGMLGITCVAAVMLALSRSDFAIAIFSRSDINGSPTSESLPWSLWFQLALAAFGILATLNVVLLSRMASSSSAD